ncbi:MAG: hypothetical protein HYZ51_01065 [Candidatus Doudnabacteria bacterium]|nr:hypothetical protein [Candidatus Doudnabacteria bacterium]
MDELNKTKENIINQLHGLCAHCSTGSAREHHCPARELALRVQHLRGVPLVVNSEFKGMVWVK